MSIVSLVPPGSNSNATTSALPGLASAVNEYDVYINSVTALAASIIIKSNDSAMSLNTFVTDPPQNGTVNTADPTTWKYYMNLAGQYHPVDTMMTVVSLDTLNVINFTVANLAVNTATAAGYAYGTYNYQQLVSRYPDQVLLIMGILYPVDINTAITAADGTILGYPPSLVEDNEYTLIPKLQKWINGYKARWYNTQFGISDTLYPAVSLGIMYLNLVPAVINARLRACKTNEAHSFHVKMYLASHGFLDQYIDLMTLSQTLFFYRNIAYIERNSGKQATFDWIVEHIMTERGLPLSKFTMKHDLINQPNQLYPDLVFIKTSVNGLVSADDQTSFTLDQVMNLEQPLAPGNLTYQTTQETNIQAAMQNSKYNTLLTKVLESTVIDYTNSSPITLSSILVNHWLWLACNGNYVAVVNVNNPVTGETYALTVKDAYIFAWYCFCGSIGIPLTTIPQMFANRVQRFNPGVDPVSDLMSVVDPSLVTEATAQLAVSLQPTIGTIISTSAFYSTCQKIYNSSQLQRNLTAYQEHKDARAMVAGLCNRIYSDNVCTMVPNGQTYAEWFASKNINITGLSISNLGTLYTSLLNQSTGLANITTTTLQQIQEAMVAMLAQLSSYGIQFITQTNNTAVEETDWTTVRVGNGYGEVIGEQQLPDMVTGVISSKCSVSETLSYDVNLASLSNLITSGFSNTTQYDLGAPAIETIINNVQQIYLNTAPVGAYVLNLPTVPNGVISVPGIDTFLALTSFQQNDFLNIFGVYQT